MITIVYEPASPAVAEIPPQAGQPKVPGKAAVPGWTGVSPEGPNLDSKISEAEHTRIIMAAIATIKGKAYTVQELTGNASKVRLGEFKAACDDEQKADTLKVVKGVHQRGSAHITAQLASNAINYHLNVAGSPVTGHHVSVNDTFHWKIVSVSAKVDNVEEDTLHLQGRGRLRRREASQRYDAENLPVTRSLPHRPVTRKPAGVRYPAAG